MLLIIRSMKVLEGCRYSGVGNLASGEDQRRVVPTASSEVDDSSSWTGPVTDDFMSHISLVHGVYSLPSVRPSCLYISVNLSDTEVGMIPQIIRMLSICTEVKFRTYDSTWSHHRRNLQST